MNIVRYSGAKIEKSVYHDYGGMVCKIEVSSFDFPLTIFTTCLK